MRSRRTVNRGFTLVEILIVVIILGILAAIVIPQFTNASEDARKSSLVSQLQTLKSQVELYKLQHHERYPTSDGTLSGTWSWDMLTTATDSTGTAAASNGTESFGPYIQAKLLNPLVSSGTLDSSIMSIEPSEFTFTTGSTMPGVTTPGGWAITPTGKLYATNKTGTKLFDEQTPGNTSNDE